jgi:hypothetical protein
MNMKLFAMVSVLLLGAACARKSEMTGPQGEKIKFDKDGKNVTVTTKDGAVYSGGENARIPDNFPKDIPPYPGAKVSSAVSAGQQAASGYMLTLETNDSPEKVTDFYKSKMSGWINKMEMASGGGKVLLLESPDGKRQLSSVSNVSNGRTTLTLTVTEKP